MKDWLGRSEEQVRHEQRMALEHRRDRVNSMRRQGYTEGEIRSAERKGMFSSFVKTIGFLVAAVAALIFITSQSDTGSETESALESSDSSYSEELQPVPEPLTEETSYEIEPEPVPAPDAGAPAVTDAPAEEIIFVKNPVVQAVPTDEAPNAEQDNVTVPDGQSID